MPRKFILNPVILNIFILLFFSVHKDEAAQLKTEREQVFEIIEQARQAILDHKIDLALTLYQEALNRTEATQHDLLHAGILNLTGLALEADGQFQRALNYYEQGLRLLSNRDHDKTANKLRQILDHMGASRKGYQASPGASIGIVLYRGEIENFKLFLDRPEDKVLPDLAIILLMNTGNMYLQQSQFEPAEQLYQNARQFAQENQFSLLEQQLLSNRIWSAMKQNQFQVASIRMDSLRKMSPEALSKLELRNALLAQGLMQREQKHYPQAIDDIAQAVSFYRQAGAEHDLGRALAHLANTQLIIKDYESARTNYLEALAHNQIVKDPEVAWFASGGLAKCYYQMESYEPALAYFKDYFEAVGSMSRSFYYDEGKTSFLESQTEMMAAYVKAAIRVAQQKQDFAIARPIIEKLRAQSLTALQEADRSWLHTEAGHLSAGYVLFHDQPGEWDRVREELYAVGLLSRPTDDFNPISQSVAGIPSRPRRVSDQPEPAVAEIPSATFLEYYLLPDQIIIFVKSPEDSINGAVTPIGADSLENLIAVYCSALELDDTRGLRIERQVVPIPPKRISAAQQSVADLAKRLYKLLITPIEKYLPDKPEQTLVIVPHRGLWQLPFAALQDVQGNYFGDRHAFSYAASVESWEISARKPRPADHRNPRAWIIGNPRMPASIEACDYSLSFQPLPGAETEARAIADLFGADHASVFTGAQADRLRLEAWHPDMSVLHFATHGFACPEAPLSSFIVLSALDSGELKLDSTAFRITHTQDPRFAVQLDTLPALLEYTWAWWDCSRPTFPGILDALTIMERFQLNTDLVTLSACQTGLGKFLSQGNIGFSRAFLAAGARSLLVSLWSVDDEATRDLMIGFYQHYLRHGNKALALQKAMQQTRQRFSHPKYWAAFTLIGLAE